MILRNIKSLFKNFKSNLFLILVFVFAFTNFTSAAETFDLNKYSESAFLVLFLIVVVSLFLFLIMEHKKEGEGSINFKYYWRLALVKLGDAKPVDKEEEILMKHQYDGISELDNNLPPWWKYLFYITIIWSFFYFGYYHVFNGPSSSEEYAMEMELAAIQKAEYFAGRIMIDETNVTKLSDAVALSLGKENYLKNCAACHGRAGEGTVGPNLTDEYWIHGGDIKNVFRVITNGVPEKGMTSWKQQLSASEIQEVSSFVLSIAGTNPPNAKAPQGEKFVVKTDTLNVKL